MFSPVQLGLGWVFFVPCTESGDMLMKMVVESGDGGDVDEDVVTEM